MYRGVGKGDVRGNIIRIRKGSEKLGLINFKPFDVWRKGWKWDDRRKGIHRNLIGKEGTGRIRMKTIQ